MIKSLLFLLAVPAASLSAATVNLTGGLLTVDYTNLVALGLSNPNHFTLPDSNTLSAVQMQNGSTVGNMLSNSGLPFTVNTGAISNPAGRALQGTTMTYDPANLTGTVTGQAGLAGVTRWDYIFGGTFLIGDYALKFDGARTAGANSGWYLENHYGGIVIPVWDLAGVTTSVTGNNFSLSGDLLIAPEFAFGFGLTAGEDHGNFSFTSVPEPSAALLGVAGLAGLVRRRRAAAKE